MAEEKILITVDVDTQKMQQDLSDAIKTVQAMKDEQKRLREEITNGNDTNGEYARQLVQVTTKLQEAQRQVKSQTAVMQAATAAGIEQNASLDQQRQYLGVLQKAYANLSGDAKQLADQEGGMRDQIKALNDSLYEQEHAIGENGRNVGNYTESILKTVPAFKKMQSGLGALGVDVTKFSKGFASGMSGAKTGIVSLGKAMLAPPVVTITVVLGAIALAVKAVTAIFDKLKEAFEKNDDAGTNLAKALAVFEPLGDMLNKVFDGIASTLGKLLGWFADGVSVVADFFGALRSGDDAYESNITKCKKLVEAQDALQEAERRYTEESAKNSRDIAKYKNMAIEADNPAKKKEYLQKAMDLEKANLAETLRIKKEQLRIIEEVAKRERDTSDATKDKIAQARAEMYAAEEAYFTGVKRLQSGITAIDTAAAKEKEQEAKRAAEAAAAEVKRQREAAAAEAKRKREEAARAAEQQRKDRAAQLKREAEELQAIADQIAARERTALEQQVYEYEQAQAKELAVKGLTEEQKAKITDYYQGKIKEARDADAEAQRKQAEEAAQKKAEEEKAKLEARKQARIEYGFDPEKTPEEQELEALQAARDQDLLNAEEYEIAKTAIHVKYGKQRAADTEAEVNAAKEAYSNSIKSATSSTGAALSALSNLLGEFAEDSEEAAKAQKAFALGSILVNQAMSIAEGAKGIAAAMAGAAEAAAATGPAAPFTLIAFQAQMVGQVLAVVASVASTIVQAKQVFEQSKTADAGSYERGGIIPGTSYTGDKLTAHVNSREMIITPEQQARLFDLSNGEAPGGYAYETMAKAISAGMAAAPAPQLALVELADAQARVTTINEIALV